MCKKEMNILSTFEKIKFSKNIGNNIISDIYNLVEKIILDIEIKYIIGVTKIIDIIIV